MKRHQHEQFPRTPRPPWWIAVCTMTNPAAVGTTSRKWANRLSANSSSSFGSSSSVFVFRGNNEKFGINTKVRFWRMGATQASGTPLDTRTRLNALLTLSKHNMGWGKKQNKGITANWRAEKRKIIVGLKWDRGKFAPSTHRH